MSINPDVRGRVGAAGDAQQAIGWRAVAEDEPPSVSVLRWFVGDGRARAARGSP